MKRRNKNHPFLQYYSDLPYKNLSWFLAGTILGSLTTFLSDPVQGNYRKALIRDKGISLKHDSRLYGSKFLRHLKNRAQGLKVRAKKLISIDETVSDEVLKERVRSKIGRYVSHPKSIEVLANDGVVTIKGKILADEVDDLINCAEKVSGVSEVINKLSVYKTPGKIPGLQGEGAYYQQS